MEVNFGKRPPYSLGVEEEFQILHGETYDLVSRFDEVAEAAGADEQIKAELLQSTVEVSTKVCRSVPEAVEQLRALRRRLRDAAAEGGSLIASAGTHPFARWEHQEVTRKQRYEDLIESMRWVAERELIFGLHVHVGLGSGQQAVAVANALRSSLPELLALSANSPFWHGLETGLASTRSKVFDAFPRSGLPPAFASWEEFELLIERAQRTNSFPDATYIWWDLRPHPRLGTLEIRICDAQTRLENVGALAALVQCLVAVHAERFDAGGTLPTQPVTLVAENKWRAARYGLDAQLIDLDRDEERPAPDAIRALVELAQPVSHRLDCVGELAAVERVLARGSGADEQRAERERSDSLLAVAQWLAEVTLAEI